ncbi:sensor domain-containing diguanylate cyclase [Jeongeupia chitinilytica]|uniref:diguanylate cyclase n=1 Tax=Jeongeupia chitinilytica TaxID=1041641 RepID=A0ABQ3H167_9NEIS|nr:sensor domain-containing diguanylate cyclase [Jeongeupia chitinilytica]GHD60694.1 hypothetical protein GCM10007350_14120 [Jeongeupia chitinilytica]
MNELLPLAFRLAPVLIAALALHGSLSWLQGIAALSERERLRQVAAASLALGGGLWVALLARLPLANPEQLHQPLPLLGGLFVSLLGAGLGLWLITSKHLRLAGLVAVVFGLAAALFFVATPYPSTWPTTNRITPVLALLAAVAIVWSSDQARLGKLPPSRHALATLVTALAIGLSPLQIVTPPQPEFASEFTLLLALTFPAVSLLALAVLAPVLAHLLKQPGKSAPSTPPPIRHLFMVPAVMLIALFGIGGGWAVGQHNATLQRWAPRHDATIDELARLQSVREDLAATGSIPAWRGEAGERLRQSWHTWHNRFAPPNELRDADLPAQLDEAANTRNPSAAFQSERDRMFQAIDTRQRTLVAQLDRTRIESRQTGAATQAVATSILLVTLLLIPGAFWLIGRLGQLAREAHAEQQKLHADMLEREALSDTLRRSNEALEGGLASLRRHLQDVSLQRELGRMLECCQTFDEARDIIRASMAKLFPESAGQLFIDNPVTAQLEEACRWGELPRSQTAMAPDDCWGVRLGQAHWLQSPQHGPRCRHVPVAPSRQSLCIPMTAQGRNQGVLTLLGSLSRSESQFSDVEHQLALSVAEQISLAIANLQLRETLKLQSISDPLTGLFNRRYLEECLRRELARAKRSRGTLGVAMIDIDYFKRYNDTYGHEAGDAVLRALAQCLLNLGRADDVVCRYGGEEFTVLLPAIDREGLTDWGERLMAAVRLLSVDFHGQRLIGITISIGAVLAGAGESDSDAPLELADAALYAAKREGRNRLRWWTPSDPSRAEAEHMAAATLQSAT